MADVRTFLRQVLAELDARKSVDGRAPARARPGSRRSTATARNGKRWSRPASRTTPRRSIRSAPPTRSTARCPEDAILVSDIGVHHNWLLQFCKPKRPDSLIGSMGFGPMGFGVAGVLGAKLAAPDRPCVAVVGDGAFFMHASVLGTAVEYELPVVWVVWNNYAYASIRGLQRGYLGGRELATDFKHPKTGAPYNPDFAAMARSAGVEGVTIDRARRSCRRGARRGRERQALPDRCDHRRRQEPGRRRRVGTARPRRQRAGHRRALSAGLRSAMAKASDLRRMALQLEGTTEAPHFDRAAFKVARIYVTLAPDSKTANFKFTPDEQELKCLLAPKAFAPIPNAWGRQGWTTATLSALSAADLRNALEMAWAHAVPKKRNRAGGGRRPDNPDRP